jgi:hypothetical protein
VTEHEIAPKMPMRLQHSTETRGERDLATYGRD